MSLVQCDTILSLVSISENSTIKWYENYDYCENIRDGRGFTVSLVGFCSGTGDLLWVFEDLIKLNPTHELTRYIAALKKVNGTKSTTGLENLPNDIKKYNDVYWKQAVWDGIIRFYWEPAMAAANSLELSSALAKGFLFDTALNHGASQIKVMSRKVKLPPPNTIETEKEWLAQFIDVRKNIIMNVDRSTNSGQPDRCLLWKSILDKGNLSLTRPLNDLVCYKDKFNIS